MSTDVRTTPRGNLARRDRLAIWEEHAGRCCICSAKIDGVRERWIVEHIRALELGGADERANMAPAHESCAIEKTKGDHSSASKAKRAKAIHLGIRKTTSRPIPGSRASGLRKRMDGTVERRR